MDDRLKTAYIGPHFGEEPPISGDRGSGTVFFSGCSLKCTFCQNYQISRDGMGEVLDLGELYGRVVGMIRKERVHNLNLVTPDHFFPHVFELVTRLRAGGHGLPVVYNCSGYQSVEALRLAAPYADIYLPDFKYGDPAIARAFSRCRNYPEVALAAVSEMVGQKGFLDDCDAPARQGVLVRHLILPGRVENSLEALTMLFLEFGADLPVSLMSQYHPVLPAEGTTMNRPILETEFERVYAHARELGFRRLFVQFPESNKTGRCSPFMPDFGRPQPFSGSRPQH
jgi:putative pyruvate formate lyase activating enzyme